MADEDTEQQELSFRAGGNAECAVTLEERTAVDDKPRHTAGGWKGGVIGDRC